MAKLLATDVFIGERSDHSPFSIPANKAHVAAAAMNGSIIGEWSIVKALYTADGTAIPTGVRVYGSNGKRYKLVGTNWGNDPTTDGGTNWSPEEAASAGATNVGATLSGTTLNLTSSSGTGAAVDLAPLLSNVPDVYYGGTAPSSPGAGDFWITTSATASPYHKDCAYIRTASAWQFLGGDVSHVSAGSLTNVTAATLVPMTVYADNNVASASGSTITVNTAGVYMMQFKHNDNNNPSFSWTGKSSTDLVGVRVELLANGTVIKKYGDIKIGVPSASPFPFPFDDSGYSDVGGSVAAGTTFQVRVTPFNCTLDNISCTFALRKVA